MNRFPVTALVIGIVSGCGSSGSAASPNPTTTSGATTPVASAAPSVGPSVAPTGFPGHSLVLGIVQVVAGVLLWDGQRSGALLQFAILPIEAVFWYGFALPIPRSSRASGSLIEHLY